LTFVAGRLEESARRPWRTGLLDAGPLAVAGVLANGGSLLVTLVLARILHARDYGALNQLIGVFFVISTPGSAVLVGVVRRVTRWSGDLRGVARWSARVHRLGGLALIGFAAVVLAAGSAIAGLLGRGDAVGLDTIALAGAVWVLLCVDRGLLQAHREYRKLSANLLLEGAARTACMIGLGAAGLGVGGVAAGVLLAEVATALHARLVASRAWGAETSTEHPERDPVVCDPIVRDPVVRDPVVRDPVVRDAVVRDPVVRDPVVRDAVVRDPVVRRDVLAAVVALAAIAVLQYADVIVMGREAPHAAGAYAAVSVSSKALVFVSVVVAGYLLPEAAISWRDGTHALRQLFVSLAIVGVPGAVLVGVAAAIPRAFLTAAFSSRYVAAAGAFLPLALAMVCLSVTVMVTMYLLGAGDRAFVTVLVAGATLLTAAAVLAHGFPGTTALADLGVQAALVCVAVAELVRIHRRRPGS
jgi:O-antigen/teichoic acid export membrane protein